MGMNMILTIIAGIVMTTMIGSTIAPSIIEGTKVTKVQTQTINNQEVIFEAIKRYVTIKQVAPTTMAQLISAGYIDAKVNDNGFGGTYTFSVSTTTGVATITTTIVDPKAQEMFLNSFMGTSKPTRVGATNDFETKFVLPNEVMHGNALLMTGVPIQNTAPDSSIYKYWYDTSSGKAVLKLYDGTKWVIVDFGAANVKVTGDQTIDGIKTFTSFPITPSSEPTSDYQVANKKYVDENGSPAGTVVAFAGTTAPVGYLFCYGQEVSRTTYAKLFAAIGTTYGSTSGTTFKVPDLRGEFIRGFDAGRGVDSGRGLGSFQSDTIQIHNHFLPTGTGLVGDGRPFAIPDEIFANTRINKGALSTPLTVNTTYPNSNFLGDNAINPSQVGNIGTFSSETRPRNIAMNYIIKY